MHKPSRVRDRFLTGDQLLAFTGVDLPEVGVLGICLPKFCATLVNLIKHKESYQLRSSL